MADESGLADPDSCYGFRMCRIVDTVKRALWGGLGCLVLLVAGAAFAAGTVAWRAQALGVAVQATSAQELRSSILLALTDRFAADQGIDVSDAEVAAYLAEMRRFMAARGQPLPDPAAEPAADRAAREEIARANILQRKIDAALFHQYGGRIARLDGALVPVDAYRRFLEAQAALGRFSIAEPAQAAAFWAPFRTEAYADVLAPDSAEAARAFDVPGAKPGPAAPQAHGAKPFDQTLAMKGIGFRVVSANTGAGNRVVITPSGLSGGNAPVSREVDGLVTGAEVADLDDDGLPEVYVFVRSGGSGAYGSLAAFGVRQRQSLAEVYLLPISEDVDASMGYMGHDTFAIRGNRLVRQFPLYRPGDRNAQPTGGSRQIHYGLAPTDTGWVLRRVEMSDSR